MPEPPRAPKEKSTPGRRIFQGWKSALWLTYFTMVSLEELQEAGLSASGAFHTPKTQVIPSSLQVLQVHAQVLDPQAAAFPHSGELCRSENNREQKSLLGDLHNNSKKTILSWWVYC